MAFNVGAIYADIKLNTKQFLAGVGQVNAKNKQMAATAGAASTSFGSMWGKMAMGVGIAAGVGLAIRALTNQFSDMMTQGRAFEDAWSDVYTLMDLTKEEAIEMRDAMIDLSPALGDTTEMAKGMYDVISASIPEDAALLVLEEAAIGAKAGVTDVATSVDALTTVLNAYGLAQGDANEILQNTQDISNIMFQTIEDGKIRYEELATSLGTVVPLAANTGVKFTELAAAMSTMTKQGVPAATTTMQLRQILASILGPSREAKEKMDELGISYGKNALEVQGLAGWLKDLEEKTKGNVEVQKIIVKNIRAFSGVLSITGKSAEAYAEALKNAEDAAHDGTQAHDAYDKKMQDFDATLDTLVVATDKFKISFYNGFVDGIEKGIPTARDFDQITKDMSENFGALGDILGSTVVQALIDFNQKLLDIQKPFKTVKLITSDIVKMLKAGMIPTLSNLNKMYKEEEDALKAEKLALKQAALGHKTLQGVLETTKQDINDNVYAIFEKNESIEDLIIALDDYEERNKAISGTVDESTEAHKNLIPKLKDTKYEFIEWLEAVADGKMDIDEYNMRIDGMSDSFINLANDLKDAEILDPEDLEPYFTELESLPSAFQSVMKQCGIYSFELQTEIEKHAETMSIEIPKYWEAFATGVGAIYGDLFWDLTDKTTTFDEVIEGYFKNWVDMFRAMVADMIQSWTEDFIKQLVSSSAEAGAEVAANLAKGVGGEGADSVADAFDSVGSAAGGLLNTLSGVANIVTAIASVAALFKKAGGPSTTDSWNFEHIQMNTKQLMDYTMIEIGSGSGWLSRIHTVIMSVHVDHQTTRKLLRERIWGELKSMDNHLGDIASNTSKMAKKLSSLASAQGGHVSTQTELVMLHGTPSNPEVTLPSSDFRSIAAAGGGGAGGQTSVTIIVPDQLDPYSAQRITRDQIVPELINAMDSNIRKRDFQRSVGIEL